jgi:hypothetical protein
MLSASILYPTCSSVHIGRPTLVLRPFVMRLSHTLALVGQTYGSSHISVLPFLPLSQANPPLSGDVET